MSDNAEAKWCGFVFVVTTAIMVGSMAIMFSNGDSHPVLVLITLVAFGVASFAGFFWLVTGTASEEGEPYTTRGIHPDDAIRIPNPANTRVDRTRRPSPTRFVEDGIVYDIGRSSVIARAKEARPPKGRESGFNSADFALVWLMVDRKTNIPFGYEYRFNTEHWNPPISEARWVFNDRHELLTFAQAYFPQSVVEKVMQKDFSYHDPYPSDQLRLLSM